MSLASGGLCPRVTCPYAAKAMELLTSRRAAYRVLADHGVDAQTIVGNGRTIPAHLQTALMIGDRQCIDNGCDVRHRLQVDHLDPVGWGINAPTTYNNLGRRCVDHHRAKTERDRQKYAPRPPRRYLHADQRFGDDTEPERGPPPKITG